MIVIGLTGGILSGKSTVSEILAEKGAVIIDADKIGHEVYKPHTETWQTLVDTFGEWILVKNGNINRRRLGDIVFNDPAALTLLNKIVHPPMRKVIEAELKRLRRAGADVVIIEAAILIEAKWTDLVDEIWVTTAPENVVIDRLQNRIGLTEEQARARIRSQLPLKEKGKHADAIINTDCSLPEVSVKVLELWSKIQKKGR